MSEQGGVESLSVDELIAAGKKFDIDIDPTKFRDNSHLEIVSHCWRYASLLQYQLSSLILHPPKSAIEMTVFTAPEDQRTIRCVKW